MQYKAYIFQICFLIGLILCGNFSRAQLYNFDQYTIEDGLAQNQILSLCQDDKGYLWFGTNNGGVSIFDGQSFRDMTQANSGLVNNVVYKIVQLKNKKMVLATNGGLSVFDGHNFTNFTTDNGLGHNRIFTLLKDDDESVWLGTWKGIAKLIDGKIERFEDHSMLNEMSIFCMFKDSKGNMWFGTVGHGVVRYDGKEFRKYGVDEGLGHKFVRTINEDKDGKIWIGTLAGFNTIGSHGELENIAINPYVSTSTITCSWKSKDGDLWFGSETGIAVWSNGEFTKMAVENGLPSNKIWDIIQDEEGNYWMGTSGNGIIKFRYKGRVFANYSKQDGLADDNISAIYEDKSKNIWIGSPKGLVRKNKEGFKIFWKNSDLVSNLGMATKAYGITEDLEGNLWVATRATGIYKYDGETWTNFSEAEGFPNNTCTGILCDRLGRMWFGTLKGAVLLTDGQFKKFDNIREIQIWSMIEDRKFNIWFATNEGAAMFNGSSTQYFSKKDGFVDGRVRKIVEDTKGNKWFATDEGVFRFDGQEWDVINANNGLASNAIYFLVLDDDGDLWIGTQKGLYRLDINRFNETKEIQLKHFGKEEGFIGMECNPGAYKDSEGKLWFGTVKGVTVFDPKLEHVNEQETRTHITNIRYEFEDYDWSQYCDSLSEKTGLPTGLVLPYDKNHLSFDFVGISFSIPEMVRYQFKLEPLDKQWLPVTTKHESVYSHVPPGEYTFKVKSKNNDGVWNENPVEFSFEILPPWYQTWWFYTLLILSVGSGFYAFIVIRTKQLKNQKIYLEKQVAERTSELREEKEKVEEINLEVISKNSIIEEKNKDIFDSINYAKRIQEALLPANAKLKEQFGDFFVLYAPKDIVSGDFYWHGVVENRSYMAAVDCTGHGVPGAFMSMIGHNLLNQVVLRDGVVEPGDILRGMSNSLKHSLQSNDVEAQDGMDMCLISVEGTVVKYAGANNPFWLIRNGEFTETKATKTPIGGSTEMDREFATHTFQMQPGDTLYLASDGYQDQFGGPKGKKFMTKRLKALLLQLSHLPMDDQYIELKDAIVSWMGEEYSQVDDVLVIGIHFSPSLFES